MTEFLNVNKVANILNVSVKFIYKLINENKIPYTKIGSRLLIPEDQLEKWLEEKTHKVS